MVLKSRIGLLISIIILFGMISVVFVNFSSYDKIIKDDIRNISRLSAKSIYSEVNNELTKPIFVSLTMANDSFVKDWIINEESGNPEEIIRYLNGITSKYGYNSAFLISQESKKYFHYNGLHKILSPTDEHDIWYYNFIENPNIYILEADQDEAGKNILTLFVNCKIFDDTGTLLGVTGVGLKMDYFQRILSDFESTYKLEAFLIDENGLVQVHTDISQIENTNIFNDVLYRDFKNDILTRSNDVKVFSKKDLQNEEFVISQYVEEFEWFLIVRKNTSFLLNSFKNQIIFDTIIYIVLTLTVLFIVSRLISKFQKKLIFLAKRDSLTGVLNRRAFDEKLRSYLLAKEKKPFSIYLFDIDDFKKINDDFGHLFGDRILIIISSVFSDLIPGSIIARWGGDEFAGIIEYEKEKAYLLLEEVRTVFDRYEEIRKAEVSISIGLTEIRKKDDEESLLMRVDKALYRAKGRGKNKIFVY